jgi:hypothetical protein
MTSRRSRSALIAGPGLPRATGREAHEEWHRKAREPPAPAVAPGRAWGAG